MLRKHVSEVGLTFGNINKLNCLKSFRNIEHFMCKYTFFLPPHQGENAVVLIYYPVTLG